MSLDELPADMAAATGPDAPDGRPLSLRQIEVFNAIMQAGSISAAGRALHVSQPAVSRVLALAEYRLGYPLFERSRGRLLPTPEARRLYAEVAEVYNGISRVNSLAQSLGAGGSGPLRIVSSASFGMRLVPLVIHRMQGGTPDAWVDYRTVTFDELVGYFLSGQADIGVSMSAPDHPHLRSQCLGTSDLVCIMPPTHPLAVLAQVDGAAFSAHAWIDYPQAAPLGRLLHGFLMHGAATSARRAPRLLVHSPVTAYAMVRQGLGAALVDRWSLPDDDDAAIVVRPLSVRVVNELWLTQSALAPMPLLGKRFIRAFQRVMSETCLGDDDR